MEQQHAGSAPAMTPEDLTTLTAELEVRSINAIADERYPTDKVFLISGPYFTKLGP
eukprot:SAG31_NODE_988_length_10542_cov_52.848319_13_plen_56_part_00